MPKPARKQLLILIIILLVIVIICCVILFKKNTTKPLSITPKGDSSKKVENNPEILSLDKKAEDARAEELKSLIAQETDKPKKAQELNELMLIYFNRRELDTALTYGLEAEKVNPTAQSAGALGDVYYAQKSFEMAAKEYAAAMSRSEKPKDGDLRSPYHDFEILKKKAEDAQ